MRTKAIRKRIWLGAGMAVVAAVVATGAFGVSGSGTITTIAGTGVEGFSGDGGPATKAKLFFPQGVAVDGKGNVYIADKRNGRVRKVSGSGKITTFAGGGKGTFGAGDGAPATSAVLALPSAVAVDQRGNVYITGEDNLVRKVSPGGTISTINRKFDDSCGPPPFTPCGTDGGPATAAELLTPAGVAVDRKGNVYIVENGAHRVRKVSAKGTITTIAGMEGKFGYSGDGGPATAARLKQPSGVAVDRAGNVYIADTPNNRIRKVSSGGRITTFAGTGKPGFSGDGGPAGRARLNGPLDVAVDSRGNVYILDLHNNRVRKVDSKGTISTIAGSGASGESGDGGPATRASFVYPLGLAVDGKGNVYISDYGSNRVRKVRP